MIKATKKAKTNRAPESTSTRIPFIQHIYELRKRVFFVVLAVAAGTGLAYWQHKYVIAALLGPANNQEFIYTTVGGGIDFLVRVCLYTGIAFSIPVIVYQLLKYLEPLIKTDAVRFIRWGSVASGVLAVIGICFGYFVGLPAALHFLLNQFHIGQIEAMLSIQSYMSFVIVYLLGSAMLFQMPLILVLINRIKPLKPKKLLAQERWIILGAFVAGAIINPSPRVEDQLLLAVPIIAMYQVGIVLVWLINRKAKPSKKLVALLEQDAKVRAERQARLATARRLPHSAPPAPKPAFAEYTTKPVTAPRAVTLTVPSRVAAPITPPPRKLVYPSMSDIRPQYGTLGQRTTAIGS